MYEIIWTAKALTMLKETLEFWSNHNKSNEYSKKIYLNLRDAEHQISLNPQIGKLKPEREIYQLIFMKGKFSIFYKINNNTLYIIHFQSNCQKPIY